MNLNRKKLMTNVNLKQLDKQENDDIDAKSEEMCMSPLRAIVSPKVLSNYQPKYKPSTFQPEQSQPVYKTKKKVDLDTSLSSRGSMSSQYSEELVHSDIEPERQGSIARLIENSKMRRL